MGHPHLLQRKLEEKAMEAHFHPEIVFRFLHILVFPVSCLQREGSISMLWLLNSLINEKKSH